MVAIRKTVGNTGREKMLAEFQDVLRRKKRTVAHFEAALERHHQRREQIGSVVRFRRQEVEH